MFPRSLILVASLPLTAGFASDALAHRRPEPPPPAVYQTDAPERYQIAEREVHARLQTPAPQTCAVAPCAPTVVVKHIEPVDVVYGRRRCATPPPFVVYTQPRACAPVVEYRPARPAYECRPVYDYRPAYDCRPVREYRPVYDCGPRSGFSVSIGIGDHHGSSFRYGYSDFGRSRGFSDCSPRRSQHHRRR